MEQVLALYLQVYYVQRKNSHEFETMNLKESKWEF